MHKKPSKALIKAYKPLVDACILACLSETEPTKATVTIKKDVNTVLPVWTGHGVAKTKGDCLRVFLAHRLLDRLHKYGFTDHTYDSVVKSRANGLPMLNKIEKLLDMDRYLDYYDVTLTNEERT